MVSVGGFKLRGFGVIRYTAMASSYILQTQPSFLCASLLRVGLPASEHVLKMYVFQMRPRLKPTGSVFLTFELKDYFLNFPIFSYLCLRLSISLEMPP